ncbi:uncharacterized protein LOC116301829 [Actinia tenebrosa]|uniref:Uncharacterized protein LOC116301829 n=1 Tax=Actinia tenebrosa TaxID=6105 RepID=A0A6P8IK61_ACTTE|nr:uncharacterized protein LOC116301829 [Actinia tenebrosa]
MRILRVAIGVVCFSVVSAVKWCSKIDNCRYATDEGVINLWSLQSWRFNVSGKSEATNSSLRYIWSPCVPWTFKPANLHQLEAPIRNCTNVAVCQIEDFPVEGSVSTDIGEHDRMNCTLTMNMSQPSCILEYTVPHQSEHRTQTNILLQCDVKQKATLDLFSVNFDHSIFTTTLHSVCACPGQCNSHGAIPQQISTGSLVIIVFVCCAFIYLIGGMTFNRIAKGARGRQMIPNLSFWVDLPYLIKDGVVYSAVFCYSCFKPKNKGYTVL